MERCIDFLSGGGHNECALEVVAVLALRQFLESKNVVAPKGEDVKELLYVISPLLVVEPRDLSEAVRYVTDVESRTDEGYALAVGVFLKYYWVAHTLGEYEDIKHLLYPAEFPAMARATLGKLLEGVVRDEAARHGVFLEEFSLEYIDSVFYMPEELKGAVDYVSNCHGSMINVTEFNQHVVAALAWKNLGMSTLPMGTCIRYSVEYKNKCFVYRKSTETIYGMYGGKKPSELRENFYSYSNPLAVIRSLYDLQDGYYQVCNTLRKGLADLGADYALLNQVDEELVRRKEV